MSGPPELKADAVFFGEILKISRYWARSDSIASWFTLAFHAPNPQFSNHHRHNPQSGTLVKVRSNDSNESDDFALILNKELAERISQALERESEASKSRAEYLQFYLSSSSLAQLNTQVRPAVAITVYLYYKVLEANLSLVLYALAILSNNHQVF